ncbi:MAG: hypothetical protein GY822_04565 [Deltaproteobacteria bacterium]|nr:hypothetical protein [Deltaproteobacteria bacterium]
MREERRFSLLHWMLALTFGFVTTAATLSVLVLVLKSQAEASVAAHAHRDESRLQAQLFRDEVELQKDENDAAHVFYVKSRPVEKILGQIRRVKGEIEVDFGPGFCDDYENDGGHLPRLLVDHIDVSCAQKLGLLPRQKGHFTVLSLQNQGSQGPVPPRQLEFVHDGEKLTLATDLAGNLDLTSWHWASVTTQIEWQLAADVGVQSSLLRAKKLNETGALFRRECVFATCKPWRRVLSKVKNIRIRKDEKGSAAQWKIQRVLPVGNHRSVEVSSFGQLWGQP